MALRHEFSESLSIYTLVAMKYDPHLYHYIYQPEIPIQD